MTGREIIIFLCGVLVSWPFYKLVRIAWDWLGKLADRLMENTGKMVDQEELEQYKWGRG